MNNKPIAIDLFSGCGGLTLGLKQAGFQVIGAVEIDPVYAETYKQNHQEVLMFQEDIRKIDLKAAMSQLGIKEGELDLLSGCPPCQGFSSIGTREENDSRNDLVFEFVRFVEAFQPKTILMENVPGLLKDKRMAFVKEKLISLGYNLGNTPMVLNAADFGVPQRRRRMILVASKYGEIGLTVKKGARQTVRKTISKLGVPGNGNDPLHDYTENRTKAVMRIIKKIPKNGGSRRNLGIKYQLDCHKRNTTGFKDVYGRMSWDDVSPTITGGCTNPSKGRFLHPEQDRAITLREASLLQTFPKSYKFPSGSKQAVATMIGNALPPKLIKVHGQEILNHLIENS